MIMWIKDIGLEIIGVRRFFYFIVKLYELFIFRREIFRG